MVKNSPIPTNQSQRRLRSQSTVLNEQLTLLYQLEQRKVAKLEEENRALRERINNLLNKEDDERIELLVADKTKRKLTQLKAITERTIKSLESGLKEFRSFVDDINEAVVEQETGGALEPAKAASSPDQMTCERLLQDHIPKLKRIPESPMITPLASSSSRHLNNIEEQTLDENREDETVEETNMFDDHMDQTLRNEEDGQKKKGPSDEGKEDKVDEKRTKADEEQVEMAVVEESLMGTKPERKEEEANDEPQEGRGDGNCEGGEKENSPFGVNETDGNGTRLEEEETIVEEQGGNMVVMVDESDNDGNNNGPRSTITFRRTTLRRTAAETVNETPTATDEKEADLTLKDSSHLTQFSSTSTQFSTPHSLNASGRQRRFAASKVQNYKEPSLSKKMRRDL